MDHDGAPPSRFLPWARCALLAAVCIHVAFLANLAGSVRALSRGEGPVGIDRFFNDPMHTLGVGADFFQFYQSGYDARHGWSIYQARTPERPAGLVVPYMYGNHYPPIVAYVIGIPLSFLSPWVAYGAWVFAMVALTWLAAFWSYRLADSPAVGCLVAAMWLAYSPWYVDVYLGQINILIAVGLLAFVRAFERDRPWRGGVVYALATAVKLFPLLYTPIFIRFRRWRPLVLCAVLLLASFVPYFLRHPEDWRFFSEWASAQDISPLAMTSGNHGLKILLYHLTDSHTAPRVAGYAFLGMALMLTFVSPSRDLRLYVGLWTCTFFFVQTFVWEHHYVILVPVLALLFLRTRHPALIMLFVLLALPTLFVFLDVPDIGRRTNPTPYWAWWHFIVYHTWKLVPVFGLYGYIVGELLPGALAPADAGAPIPTAAVG